MILVPYVWLTVFFLVPFLIVLKISLSQTAIAQPPYTPVFDPAGGLPGVRDFLDALSLDNYALLTSDPIYLISYVRSVVIAAVSTALLLLIGFPLAYGMTRAPRRWQAILFMLVVLPFWTSFLIRIYAWINILQREGLLNKMLRRCASSTYRRSGSPAIRRSISGSSTPICHSWCCPSMRRSRSCPRLCWRPPPISAARAGRRSGW